MAATSRAVSRARWLGELYEALDRAGKLTLELGAGVALGALGADIVALRGEVESLLRGGSIPYDEVPPDWAV